MIPYKSCLKLITYPTKIYMLILNTIKKKQKLKKTTINNNTIIKQTNIKYNTHLPINLSL